MTMTDGRPERGDVVAGLEPDEHVEIRSVASFGTKLLIEGIGLTSRREIRRPLDTAELARVTVVRGPDFTFDGDSDAFL